MMIRFFLWVGIAFSVLFSLPKISLADLTSTQLEYESTLQKELIVENLHSKLIENGYSAQDFYSKIVEPLNQGQFLDEEYLSSWEEQNSEFHQERYSLMMKKQHFFIVLTHVNLHDLINSAISEDSNFLAETKKRLSQRFNEAHEIFLKWADASDSIKEGINPKVQRERMYSFRNYFNIAREILKDLELAPTQKSSPQATQSEQIRGMIGTGLSSTYIFFQVLTRNAFSAANYLNPLRYILPISWKTELSRYLLSNFTPLTSNWGIPTAFRNFAAMKGYKVKVIGQHYLNDIPLQAVPNKKTVNLFLPSHRSDMVDAIVMSHLGLPHFLIFANPSAFAGNIVLGTMIASLPEFISVGKWRGLQGYTPTEKLMMALDENRSPNVINYPQGFVANAGEILPINANFVKKLLSPLISHGYKVNVIPISYEVDSSHLSQSGGVDEIQVSATIHQPLYHNAVETLVKKQIEMTKHSPKYRYFDHFLNTLWFENIERHKELELNALIKRAQENLGLKFNSEWIQPNW